MARGAIRVVSINGPLTVTFTAASGATPTVFSDEACTTTVALPATVADGAATTFYFASPGAYTLSVKTAAGIQIAGDLNSTKVVSVYAGDVGVYSYDARLVAKDFSGDSGRHSPATDLAATYMSVGQTRVDVQGKYAGDLIAAQTAEGAGKVYQLGQGTTTVAGSVLWDTGTKIKGDGPGITTLKLANSANVDLLTVTNYATLAGSNSTAGTSGAALEDLTLDGNGANQSGTSWTMRVYGHDYRVDNVEIINGRSGNVASEWGPGGSGSTIESFWSRVKLVNPITNGATNLDWKGPHDSQFSQMAVVAATGAGPSGVTGQIGIRTHGNAANELFEAVHVWGFHQYGWYPEFQIASYNCIAEGAYGVNLMALSNNITFEGQVFGTSGFHPNEIGVQIGDGTHTNIRQCRIDINTFGWAAGAFPLSWVSTAGTNRVRGVVTYTGATALSTGSPNTRDDVAFISLDGANIDVDQERVGHPVRIFAGSNNAFQVGSFSYNNNSQHSDIVSGGTHRGWKDSFVTQTFDINSADGSVRHGTTTGMGSKFFSGTGAPTFSATAGDMYQRTDGGAGTWLYRNTGTTTWVAVV